MLVKSQSYDVKMVNDFIGNLGRSGEFEGGSGRVCGGGGGGRAGGGGRRQRERGRARLLPRAHHAGQRRAVRAARQRVARRAPAAALARRGGRRPALTLQVQPYPEPTKTTSYDKCTNNI